MIKRSSNVAVQVLLSLVCLYPAVADTKSGDVALTDENYKAWRDHILPADADLGWQQIPWLTTFQDGILEADQRKMPLLFWTMNGHPLGCT